MLRNDSGESQILYLHVQKTITSLQRLKLMIFPKD